MDGVELENWHGTVTVTVQVEMLPRVASSGLKAATKAQAIASTARMRSCIVDEQLDEYVVVVVISRLVGELECGCDHG